MKKIFGNDTYFARFMNVLADIIWTGMLWILTSIPVITLGASSCAAYQTMIRVVRGKSSGVTATFIESFKENFKVTWLLKLFGILFFGWLGFDCIYLYGYGTDFSKTLSIILYVILAVYIAIVSYLYPLISRFDESRFDLFKLAFYLTFRYFPISLLLIVLFVASLFGCYMMPWSVIIMPGLYWYFMSIPVKWAIGKMAGDTEDEDIDDELIGESIVSEKNKPENRKMSKLTHEVSDFDDKYDGYDYDNDYEDDYKRRNSESLIEKGRRLVDSEDDNSDDTEDKGSTKDRIVKKRS